MARANTAEPAAGEFEDTHEVDVPEAPAARKKGQELVNYRVTKQGDGKIHTGRHLPYEDEENPGGPEFYKKNEIVEGVPRKIVDQLEDRNFVEILDDE